MPPMTFPNFRAAVHQFEYSDLGNHHPPAPPTGIGGFHAQYTPSSGELLITAKMFLDFQPDPAALPNMQGAAAWPTKARNEFSRAFKKLAAEFWSGKRGFRCTLAGFTTLRAVPKINVQFVTVQGQAHFVVHIYPGGGPSGLMLDGSLKLYQLDVHSNYQRKKKDASVPNSTKHWYERTYKWARQQLTFNAAILNVLDSEATKFRQQLAPHTPINFAMNSWTIELIEDAKLTQIAQVVRAAHPDDPKFPLLITGHYDTGREPGIELDTRRPIPGRQAEPPHFAQRRAEACQAALKAKGVNREFQIRTQGKNDADRYRVKVDIDNNPASLQNLIIAGKYKYNYTIAIHEFGHCLALPDEYMLYTSPGYPQVIRDAHQTWVALCAAVPPNGVPANPYGDGPQYKNNSIMSHGTVVNDCHYVTMWDALCKATEHTVPANNWEMYTP